VPDWRDHAVNLDLDSVQRRLAEAVRERSLSAAEASGWEIFKGLGLTELLTSTPSPLGLFEWCLVMEELGAGCRDLTLISSVRTFSDVFGCGRGDTNAAAALRIWLRHPPHREPIAHRYAGDGRETLRPTGTVGLREVTLTPREADRELLSHAAYAVGVGRRCLEVAQERAADRVIGGRRLIEYQGTSHRLANSALALLLARIGLWRAAKGEDQGQAADYRAPAVAAACVSAVLDCAHDAVQVFGAAGTSDEAIVQLYKTAYFTACLCGSPRVLGQSAGTRWLDFRCDDRQYLSNENGDGNVAWQRSAGQRS
jgi:hypothetical protein